MKVLIVNTREVMSLLPMGECIDVMEAALKSLARGEALMPLRTMMVLPGRQDVMGLMPSYLGGLKAMGVKAIAAFPSNAGTDYDTHVGVVLVFDAERGALQAVVDGTAITAIRTAAVSAAATRRLARPEAGDLALIGAGTQARTHLEAMRCVRPIRRVRVYSLPLESAYKFAERESKRQGLPVEVKTTAREAVEGADLICTVSSAGEPVVKGEWIAPGTHINAVGAFTPTTRELDTAAVAKSRLYVDRREATLNEAGEFLIPKREGAIDDRHIVAELGEVFLGKAPARQSATEITLFKSLGLAIEDLAAAHHIFTKAQAAQQGTWVEIGGGHFAEL